MSRVVPLRTIMWAVALPATAAACAGGAAVFSLTDSEYTLTAILATYAVLMPGVAVRNARALGVGPGADHKQTGDGRDLPY